MKIKLSFILAIICALILVSCSGKGTSTPVMVDDSNPISVSELANSNPGESNLWGVYDIILDPETKEASVGTARTADYAMNLVTFFNQIPSSLDVIIINHHTGPFGTIVYVDMNITHPYGGNSGLNAYDIRGIFMGDGSGTMTYNGDLKYALPDVDQSIYGLDNADADKPDGYTRWFNKPEFSTGGAPIFSYTQSKIAPGKYAPTATLNPYHYFANGLDATDDACEWLQDNPASNGVFTAGITNTRRMAVRFPVAQTLYQFGYAVVANWEGTEPIHHPSNADEAIAAKATVHDGLYYEDPTTNGGYLKIDFTLYGCKSITTNIYIE